MNQAWENAIVYHLFPLGSTGAPSCNDFVSPAAERLKTLHDWLPYLRALGVNTLLLGPVLESSAHGYDTADLYRVDRRLGTNDDLRDFVTACHEQGLRVLFDAVFHHVGRDFWAFRDVLENGEASRYRDWFFLNFTRRGPPGDPFAYEGWAGHFDLVKLDTSNPAVREHLFGAVRVWLDDFGGDGLRLDAADVLDKAFQRDLARFCRELKPDCTLVGEVVHGDYRDWANESALDGTTNYELYKGLYSSHNDSNLFEVAYSLKREFGEGGVYKHLPLLNFADNHDVPRLASILTNPAHLYPLYLLLFTVPGVPSVYYGSEWGVTGTKAADSDAPLRPTLSPEGLPQAGAHPDLFPVIQRFIRLRQDSPVLRLGDYREVHVAAEQLAFTRSYENETVLVAINIGAEGVTLELPLAGTWEDELNGGEHFVAAGGSLRLPLGPTWGRVLRCVDNR